MKTHPPDTRPIRDFVIPICELVPTQDGKSLNKEESKLCGTCFLIGDQGFAITAAHVVEQSTDEFRFGMVAVGDEERTDFYKIKVLKHEKHPTEDVSIIKFEMFPDGKRISYFKINLEKQFSSLDYHMWSYPIAVAEEVKYHNIPSDFLDFRPDLTVFKGYIRRRMPFSPNPSYSSYRGKIFYEPR